MGEENKAPFGNIPANTQGSSLVGNSGEGHAKQPSGKSIGSGDKVQSGYSRSQHHADHLNRNLGGKGHQVGKR